MVGALDPRDDCTYPIATQLKDVLRRGHLFSQRLAQLWWEKWYLLYVFILRYRKKMEEWTTKHRDFKIGDLVLLCDETLPKFLKYSYAIVTEVKRDFDNHVGYI